MVVKVSEMYFLPVSRNVEHIYSVTNSAMFMFFGSSAVREGHFVNPTELINSLIKRLQIKYLCK